VGTKLGKGNLSEGDRVVVIAVAKPGEDSTKKVIYIAHEINLDVFGKFSMK